MPHTSREVASLHRPPDDPAALEGFPFLRLSSTTALFRVVHRGKGPWWFGSSMRGRFDLAEPAGTCYLVTDEISALLEVIGPDLERGAISSDFLKARSLRKLRLPEELDLSDLTSREAVRFGITSEIGTLVPYDLAQKWAAALHSAGSPGLAYWPRHDPARKIALALFGPHGERKRWKRGRESSISAELIERLREECGIEVLDVPRSDELTLIGE
ncbi:MAG TPA: RES family NAD+ phosphorylase [Thermoanaerobaculia bacterium]|nr:RES family NAD+ phosphorylase [Thermoanaerobaculia bacterium]